MNTFTHRDLHIEHAQNSGVAISIMSGYFNDPDDCPGLAHLCEHVLMHGHSLQGGLNEQFGQYGNPPLAQTGPSEVRIEVHCEGCDIPEVIDEFIHYLANFQVEEQVVAHEINIIAQEFSHGSNDPIRRLQEVDKTTCNPNHPYAKFSTGNAETFVQLSQEKLIHYIEEWINRAIKLLQFTCYVTHGLQGLNTRISQQIDASFLRLGIVTNPIEKTNPELPLPYTENECGHLIHVDLPTPVPKLIFHFVIETQHSDALDLLLWIFNYSPPNFCLSQLHQQGFITRFHLEKNQSVPSGAGLNLHLSLSEKGILQRMQIIAVIFELFKKISLFEAPEMYWDQVHKTRNIFSGMNELTEHTHEIDAQLIDAVQSIIEQCIPSSSRVLFICAAEEYGFMQQPICVTPYYKTRYQVEPLNIQKVLNEPLCQGEALTFYFLNPLLNQSATKPVDMTPLLKRNINYSESLVAIHSAHPAQLTECYIGFNQSDLPLPSQLSIKLGIACISEMPQNIQFYAQALGCQVRMYAQQQGMTLHFRAPLYIAHRLIEPLLDTLNQTNIFKQLSTTQWQRLKETVLQSLNTSEIQNIESFAMNAIAHEFSPQLSYKDKQSILSLLTPEQAQALLTDFLALAEPEIMVFGSYDNELLDKLSQNLVTSERIKPTEVKRIHTHKQHLTLSYHPLKHNVEQSFCGVLFYSTTSDINEHVDWMLLAMLLQNAFFQFIRQKHQLSYECNVSYLTHRSCPGILLSATHNDDTPRVKALFKRFVQECNQRLDMQTIKSVLPHLKSSLAVPQNEFSIQANYYWMMLGKPEGLEFNHKMIERCQALAKMNEYPTLAEKLAFTSRHLWVLVNE